MSSPALVVDLSFVNNRDRPPAHVNVAIFSMPPDLRYLVRGAADEISKLVHNSGARVLLGCFGNLNTDLGDIITRRGQCTPLRQGPHDGVYLFSLPGAWGRPCRGAPVGVGHGTQGTMLKSAKERGALKYLSFFTRVRLLSAAFAESRHCQNIVNHY